MKGFIFIDNYKMYQPTIQKYFEKKEISNIENFNFRIFLKDNSELKPEMRHRHNGRKNLC